MIDMHNFSENKDRAICEMLEMNKRADKSAPSCHASSKKQSKKNSSNIALTFSSDELLIMGLFFILYKDCDDIWLFLALLYILM